MKTIANNLFYNWKTTLLGVVVIVATIYLVERHVIDNDTLSGAIEAAAVLIGGWLGLGARDRMPRFSKRKDGCQ